MLPLDKAELLVKSIANAELIAARKHTVKKGETLSIIADQYGVSYLKLAQWNELSVKSVLLPGQELVIYPESQT
jgi:LysM repeat protein